MPNANFKYLYILYESYFDLFSHLKMLKLLLPCKSYKKKEREGEREMVFHVPAFPLHIQQFANASGKATEDGPSFWVPEHMKEFQKNILAYGLSQVQTWAL